MIQDSQGDIVASGDDEGNCGRQTVLEDVNLVEGSEHTIILSGYENANGLFSLEITCSNGDTILDDTCVDTFLNPIGISCDETVSENTANNCDSLAYFSLHIPNDARVTISTCDSDFDTMLLIQDSQGDIVVSGDDEGDCGRQTVLENARLEGNSWYSLVLGGYQDANGRFSIDVSCGIDDDPTDDNICVDESLNIIPISCNEVVNGNTANNCNHVAFFSLNAPAHAQVGISTCGSNFDTILLVQNSQGDVLAGGDDEGDCGRQTVLEDVELGADSDNTIILGGFEDANGLFTLEITCATTAEPTMEPTGEITLSPTSDPTIENSEDSSLPSEIFTDYQCLNGCEESNIACHHRQRVGRPCRQP